MDINIKRFVNIDIKHHVSSSLSSIRDTVALMTSEGTTGDSKVFDSYADFEKDVKYKAFMTAKQYAKVYFDNGGIKLDVHCGISDADSLSDAIEALPDKEIVVAYAGSADIMTAVAGIFTSVEGDSSDISSLYGIDQKILLVRLTKTEDLKDKDNLCVKISSVVGAEMTIAAYLSKLAIYGTDTVKDYAFTVENITAEPNDDEELGKVLDNNMNVDMSLANAIRNLGGNMTNGYDLVNQYVLIVLQQTVTDRLLNLLTQKIKGQSGVSAIYTTIAGELSKYVTNGYLTTDKLWTDDTKAVTYNGKTYVLIEKNTPLTLGYHISVLPLSSLSDEDKAAHKCPPVYIFLAESYGIRTVTINGEVI